MPSELSKHELVALLAGETNAAVLAERHGVTVAEVERCQRAFVWGLKAGAEVPVPSRRRFGRVALTAALVVASAAFAQLTVFQQDTPAVASQVNGNFNQLRTWIESKVGSVTSNDVTIASPNKVAFGATTRQMIDLYNAEYGIGVQASTGYFRSGGGFAWYRGGSHNEAQFNAGGGSLVMRLVDSPPRLAVGNHWMLGAQEERLTTVRGTYNHAGPTTLGAGYTVTRVSGGAFDVTFTRPFSGAPSVLCSTNHPTQGPQSGGVAHCLVSHPVDVSSSTFRVFIVDGQNAPRDWPFSFIAIGPAPTTPLTTP